MLQNSFARCCTHLHCFLQHMPSFWNSPEGGMTTLDFIVSNCIGHNETRLWASDENSDVIGLVMWQLLLQQEMFRVIHHSDLFHVFWVVLPRLKQQTLLGTPTLLPHCYQWRIPFLLDTLTYLLQHELIDFLTINL